MKKLTGFMSVLLTMILALSMLLATAEQVKDEVNAIGMSGNANHAGNFANESGVLSHFTNPTCTVNSTNLKKSTSLENATEPSNSTAIKNSTALENLTVPENISTKDKVVINASVAPFDVGPRGKSVFVIDNGVTPIKSAGNSGQASVNGASLMRAVDGTPHGYTTYYN